MKKKELFSIPNLMSYFRILLIPIIIWSFLEANTASDYKNTAILVILSAITDFLDGKIARKFHMVTELGKAIDPIADKLTLGALFICISLKHSIFFFVLILFLIKEGFMGIMGLLLLKRNGKKLDGAKWYGKVCTAFLYLVMLFYFIFPKMSLSFQITLIIICAAFMLFTLFSYVPVFYAMWNDKSED